MPEAIRLPYRYDLDPPETSRFALVRSDALSITWAPHGDDPPDPQAQLDGLLDEPLVQLVSSSMVLRELGTVVVQLESTPAGLLGLAELGRRALATGAAVLPGLSDESGTYLLYAEGSIVVRLEAPTSIPPAWLVTEPRWVVERNLAYAPGAFVLRPRDPRVEVLVAIASELESRADVAASYPVWVQGRALRGRIEPEIQWHLGRSRVGDQEIDASAHVVEAWKECPAGQCVAIAIVEPQAMDHLHPDLIDGIKLAVDVSRHPQGVPMKVPTARGQVIHATSMAGVAAARRSSRTPGVAPQARLIAVQIGTALGSLAEADGIAFAAAHGASVISCSWGPELQDGVKQDPPPHTRWAVEHALRAGGPRREGSVVLFSAGNEAEDGQSLDQNGYACIPFVLAVGAANSKGHRAVYSNEGDALWCVFPSGGDLRDDGAFDSIETLDVRGLAGMTQARGPTGNYFVIHGQTSAACAGAAGVVALMLSVNDRLRPADVRSILAATCDPIAPSAGTPPSKHNRSVGYGRVHALRAVLAARAWA